ncbi:VOC family protein [Flavobacterium hercynium]|uniref:Glyoxalase n=1 Tax=Flavobacterium hercynium TaxID=387094 RepID=A0A226HAI6_9FLAO|nr:VOC family protein [Flavobacterium hercynium]OXA90440.1 glyoxalase [Flavobacterium hercynium]SMP26321.1 Catechol-2,3-dioxygenase [Flavobacterium hercynium]
MKLEHIQIQTNDIQKTADFYSNVLELQILEQNSKSVTIQAGASILKFTENTQFDSTYHFAFNIPENKLKEAIQWCQNKVGLLLIEDQSVVATFENWNANAVYFYDNNKNLLEFIARNDLNNSSTAIFNSKLILNISEIGIVDENPFQLGQKLNTKHGLDFFTKNQNSEFFSALGDDEGLLIIVQPKRNWYPTQIPSESNPTEIRIQNNNEVATLIFK